MTSKVALIDPEGYQSGLNTGLGYICATLADQGHEVKVIDFNNRPGHEKERLSVLNNFNFVGISIKSATSNNAIKIASLIPPKKSLTLVCGGPHISLDGVNFLKNYEFFDIGVVGEGEEVLCDITNARSLLEIRGIIYRDANGDIIKNPARDWIADLDSLPFPRYDLFDSVIMNDGMIACYPLITSRGCPYQCVFCCVKYINGKKWRTRSPKNVIEELIFAKEKYGIKEFKILDDNFTVDLKRAKEICQRLIDEKLGFVWGCPNGVRADRLDTELLELMKISGCGSISIGIESCIPHVFDKLNKGEKLQQVMEAVREAKKMGLKIQGFFIIGLLGSTLTLDKKSIEIARKMNLDEAIWNLLLPYPRTPLWNIITSATDVRMLRHWSEGFHFGSKPKVIFETDDYKEEERLRSFYYANLKFKNYYVFRDRKRSSVQNMLGLLKIAIKYDPLGLPYHLCYAIKQCSHVSVVKRIPRW